ncbi:uncharacterized protein LOC119265935 isoform X2 [Pygocentrus nattereri]|uniref:uncharacterized protein LOC119265935 isoform X2 n=1 Tax=Pygocentrus nattereri TaxID=42514 RepID=UPI00189197D6|nr:uncharacterized protein LOC119265935 isoform X2 [Pygocentrus nattereri]
MPFSPSSLFTELEEGARFGRVFVHRAAQKCIVLGPEQGGRRRRVLEEHSCTAHKSRHLSLTGRRAARGRERNEGSSAALFEGVPLRPAFAPTNPTNSPFPHVTAAPSGIFIYLFNCFQIKALKCGMDADKRKDSVLLFCGWLLKFSTWVEQHLLMQSRIADIKPGVESQGAGLCSLQLQEEPFQILLQQY